MQVFESKVEAYPSVLRNLRIPTFRTNNRLTFKNVIVTEYAIVFVQAYQAEHLMDSKIVENREKTCRGQTPLAYFTRASVTKEMTFINIGDRRFDTICTVSSNTVEGFRFVCIRVEGPFAA